MATYRVLSDTSTRASPDPDSPEYETWVFFAAGDLVTKWPDHAPVDAWTASGHWEAVPDAKPPEPEEES